MQTAVVQRMMGSADGNIADDMLRGGKKVGMKVESNTCRGHGFGWLEYRLW